MNEPPFATCSALLAVCLVALVALTGRIHSRKANINKSRPQMADVQALAAQVQALHGEIQHLRASQAAAAAASVPMVDDEEEEVVADDVSWSDVLSQARRTPSNEEAARFTKLLASAPSLQALKENRANVQLYLGVPESPGARQNRVDSQLQAAQQKIELGLHLLTHYLETGNRAAIGGAAAWYRSAWEDLNQQRRQFLAGKEAWKLGRRNDDHAGRLLTEEEEKKLSRGKGVGKGNHDRGRFRDSATSWARKDWAVQKPYYNNDWSRARSLSRGRGKGKGRGRGRGQDK